MVDPSDVDRPGIISLNIQAINVEFRHFDPFKSSGGGDTIRNCISRPIIFPHIPGILDAPGKNINPNQTHSSTPKIRYNCATRADAILITSIQKFNMSSVNIFIGQLHRV